MQEIPIINLVYIQQFMTFLLAISYNGASVKNPHKSVLYSTQHGSVK
jgi:hypothetical protein